MINILRSITFVALAGLLLAACEEEPQQSSGTYSGGAATTTPASAPAPVQFVPAPGAASTQVAPPAPTVIVWPPAAKGAVTIEPNLLKLNIMVVYDGSGSMGDSACGASGNRHESAVPAVKKFVDAVPTDANLGLFVFDSNGTTVRVPLTSNNKAKFNAALDKVQIGQGTPLKYAIEKSYEVLKKQAQAQLGYGRYLLLVVTDGEANTGQNPTRIVNFMVDKTPVEVHTVGLCFSGRHSLNQPGRTFYTDAQNPQQLVDGLKGALAEATEDQVTFD